MKKRKNKFQKYLLLSWKRVGLIVLAWFASAILHNVISGLFGVEEPVFFILAVLVIPIYFIVTVIYFFIRFLKKN